MPRSGMLKCRRSPTCWLWGIARRKAVRSPCGYARRRIWVRCRRVSPWRGPSLTSRPAPRNRRAVALGPFLKLFGLPGLYFSFALVLLPLSAVSVYVFAREFSGDQRWASYSALAFLALPLLYTQPFSGYIDFAVIGALAF